MAKSKFDKTCILCGKYYQYCPTCSDYSKYPRWMTNCCSENCHTIFNTIMDYRIGSKTPAECKAILEKCDLSSRDKYEAGMNAFVTAILAENTEENKEAEIVEVVEAVEAVGTIETIKDVEVQKVEDVKEEKAEDVVKANPEKKKFNNYNYKKVNHKK